MRPHRCNSTPACQHQCHRPETRASSAFPAYARSAARVLSPSIQNTTTVLKPAHAAKPATRLNATTTHPVGFFPRDSLIASREVSILAQGSRGAVFVTWRPKKMGVLTQFQTQPHPKICALCPSFYSAGSVLAVRCGCFVKKIRIKNNSMRDRIRFCSLSWNAGC